MLLKIKPLSVNKSFYGKHILTKEARQYMNDVIWELKNYKGIKVKGNYKIKIIFTFKSKSSDLSNAVKLFEDCLKKAEIIKDDHFCQEILLIKKIDKKESIEFEIYEL